MNGTRICVREGCERVQHGRGVCRSHYMECWRGLKAWPDWQAPVESRSDRFWAKVEVRGDIDCWPWRASRLRNGYGQFAGTTAHRASFEIAGGTLTPGSHIDHLCRNRWCVNPAHLEQVSPSENATRGIGGMVAAVRMQAHSANRTHCMHGHELTSSNTYVTPKQGWRQCRTCRAEKARSSRERRSSENDS